MNNGYIEFFKITSPFIMLAISWIIKPLIMKFYSSWVSFFSLPTNEKIEAIEYINGFKKSSNTIKKLKHTMRISDYKLHENTDFSRCVIGFYYADRSKNAYFSKSLLRAKGLYVFDCGRISINGRNVLFAIAFWIFTFLVYGLTYEVLHDWRHSVANAVFSTSLIIASVCYTLLMFTITSRFISIVSNIKRFNRYLSDKV